MYKMENKKYIEWKVTKQDVKKFPIQYVLDCEDQSTGYCDFELGDNPETMKLFSKYDFLVINTRGNLYGIRGNTSFDIIIDGVPLNDEEIEKLNTIYEVR